MGSPALSFTKINFTSGELGVKASLLLLIPVSVFSDCQETTITEHPDKLSSVKETTKQIQAAQEEDEEEEDAKGDQTGAMTEENSRGE